MKVKHRFVVLMLLFVICSAFAIVLGCAFGASRLSLAEVLSGIFTGEGTAGVILRSLRLPRVLGAFLVGGALPVCGCALQGLFKNPMADTGVLGISAGASLGVTIALVFFGSAAMGGITVFAFVFGCLTVVLLYALSRILRSGTLGLLLSGVCCSAFLSAAQGLVLMLDHTKLEQVYSFMMGSLSGVGWQQLAWCAPLIIVGSAGVCLLARPLNLLQLGEEQAVSAGVNEPLARGAILLLTALVCSAAVTLGGLISFVGLIIPHCMRLLVGGDYKYLLPLSFVSGGAFLVLTDLLARTALSPIEIPIGIITSILGAPVFFILLAKKKTA